MSAIVLAITACQPTAEPNKSTAKTELGPPTAPSTPGSTSTADALAKLQRAAQAERTDTPRTLAHDDREALRHMVVYADRTSQGYLVIWPPAAPAIGLDRKQLLAELAGNRYPELATAGPEFLAALKHLVEQQPHATEISGEPDAVANNTEISEFPDLLGFFVDEIELDPGEDGILAAQLRTDPVLTRSLKPEERDALAGATSALVLRADYRVAHQVRGLRLLQAIVAALARPRNALVHDHDTLETQSAASFYAARYEIAGVSTISVRTPLNLLAQRS